MERLDPMDAMQEVSPVIGIDLGTTNSVVAVCVDGRVRVLEEEGTALVPSVVGIGMDGRLLVGQSARNQLAAFPDRTIASVKRRMGQAVMLPMAGTSYTPQEISSIILRALKDRAERALGRPVSRAVITVPAFFDEPQRQATLGAGTQAGAIAGQAIGPVLVDVATHTLGVAAVEDGPQGEHLAYVPILRRNAPLPARYEHLFFTHDSEQDMAAIQVFQGESPRLEDNREIGRFMLEGLNATSACDGRIFVRFELSLDGTLEVTAIESTSGISQRLAIVDALSKSQGKAAAQAAERLGRLPGFGPAVVSPPGGTIDDGSASGPEAADLHAAILHRARQALPALGPEDAADVERLVQLITEAHAADDDALLAGLVAELDDLLFYAAG